jgi:hypothetical protein
LVYELTGMQTTIPEPYFRSDASDPSRPFVDESTPLLNGALTHFNVANAQGEPFVFVADLGGETLDVQLVALSRQKNDNSYRIVACESVRIGANCAVDYLQKLVSATYNRPQAETAVIVRTILNRVIRTGQLGSALRAGATVPLMGSSVSWKSADGPKSFLNQLDCYFGVLVEYCARFVAGTLRNRNGLRARLRVGPGPGAVSEKFLDTQPTVYAVQPYLIGNGWKMLSLFLDSISGASIDDPMKWITEIFFRRVSELLDPEKLEIVEKDPDQASLFMDKTLTALGTIRLGAGEPRRDGMVTSVLAAPNGYDDRANAQQYAWSTLVGAGGETVPNAMQNELLMEPPLPDAQKITITGPGAQWYHKLSTRGIPGRKDDLFRVRRMQEGESTGNARERREVSAARAAWEMVLRPELLQLG